ncbi:hypothetical protein C475_20243 [Halosimplex carlsbadense 2-9-1]|uniref:DUF7311 domain-containing protein n=1 Tax=Halosimplex carlsbadense 2-9-1 TaxID=797114 RepID=M0CBM2_9EURY|nr:hypothetical protein [Halosimplex carlsbadense]ELZ20630.1 hypothetical protein C475_20243 [Halosimplex carlsbadense 2-9-1]
MVRVAFTVVLLVAVAGVAVPAVEYAGVQRSDTAVRDAVERIVSEARALAAGNGALPPGAGPARRSVSLGLPTEGFASAGVERFGVGPPLSVGDADGGLGSGGRNETAATRFTWRVVDGTEHTVVVDGVRIRPIPTERLRIDGQTRLVLTLVAVDGRTVVRVR